MAFTVEDGTGKSDANSYVSTEFADSYFTDRSNTVWTTATDASKKVALINATDYIDRRFYGSFKGVADTDTQALQFPRDGKMPVPLLKATCEYAVRALKSPLAPDPLTDATGLQVKSTEKKLGPLGKKIEYEVMSPSSFTVYPNADALLKPLFKLTGGVIR